MSINLLMSFIFLINLYSNPLFKKYNEKTYYSDAIEIIDSKVLNEMELRKLGEHILLSKINGRVLSGMTYKEILINSKKFDYYRNPSDFDFKKRDFFNNILFEKSSFIGFKLSDGNEFLILDMRFINKSKKSIKTVIGSLGVPVLGLNNIQNISASFINGIKPNEEKICTIKIPSNPFNNRQRLSFGRKEDPKYLWLPVRIIFEDGSILE